MMMFWLVIGCVNIFWLLGICRRLLLKKIYNIDNSMKFYSIIYRIMII